MTPQDAWDYALWVEGWMPALYQINEEGNFVPLSAALKVIVDPPAQKVTVRVPKSAFGDGDPAQWGYLAVVLSQEGYPSEGVMRVRDIEAQSQQWRFGGAPADTNHTRIVDLYWPGDAPITQEALLSAYPPSQETNMDNLTPDDFAQLPMLRLP